MFKRHKINNKIKTRLQNLLYLRDFEKLFSSSTVIAIFSFLKLKKMRASKKKKGDDSVRKYGSVKGAKCHLVSLE